MLRRPFFQVISYKALESFNSNINHRSRITKCTQWGFRIVLFITALIFGFSLYFRTTNMWALKNLSDTFLNKQIGLRPIIIGAFHRPLDEQNVKGAYAVLQFVGDSRNAHSLYCLSKYPNNTGKTFVSRALIQRIHSGKRAANDICSWSGHLAECEIATHTVKNLWLSSSPKIQENERIAVELEVPLKAAKKHDLVVCVAPLYIYTDWQILLTGIETWFALGATLFVFPLQSASNDTYIILKTYESQGKVLIRHWPKWPVLSDINPNGLVLSRGIEESHVNCLHYVKPIANMIAFTDIDDMLMPINPQNVKPNVNVEILKNLFNEHPNAGSMLFEHRDVQFVLPSDEESKTNSLQKFNFDFLIKTQWKTNCKVWRMKTRVVVNASRVDSVNMHETGIHRFLYVQVRVPCRQAHFYHLRHSYKNIAVNEWPIQMNNLQSMLNLQWNQRLKEFGKSSTQREIVKSSTESFEDFDRCMSAINEEHWTMKVSRCLTPHVCYSKLARKMACMAVEADYAFAHAQGDYVSVLQKTRIVESEPNCEAPIPKFVDGNHYYYP